MYLLLIMCKNTVFKELRIPEDKKEEYEENQRRIKMYIEQGKTKEEIRKLIL